MTCEFIKQKLDNGAVLLDVRSIREFNDGRLKDAQNVPLEQMELFANVQDKGKELLLYCRSGARSQMATNYLNSLGFTAQNVGGINQFIGCLDY